MRQHKNRRFARAGMALAGIVGFVTTAQAQDVWDGGNGDWADFSWNTGQQILESDGNPPSPNAFVHNTSIDLSNLLAGQTLTAGGGLRLSAMAGWTQGAGTLQVVVPGGNVSGFNIGQDNTASVVTLSGTAAWDLTSTGTSSRALHVNEGSLTLSDSASITIQPTNSNPSLAIADGGAFTMNGTSTMTAEFVNFDTNNAASALFTLNGGTVTLNSSNAIRRAGAGAGGVSNVINFTGAAGSASIIHTDLSGTRLASEVSAGQVAIDGTIVTDSITVVGGKRLSIAHTATQDTLSVVNAAGFINWTVDADGNWSDTTWTGGSSPNSASAEVGFSGTTATSDRTVTMDTNATVSQIIFAEGTDAIDSSATSYTIADGGGVLTLGGSATIESFAGAHTIATVIGGSGGLTKTGAGELWLSADNTYSGTTTIDDGNLRLLDTGAVDGAVTVNATGQLVFQGDGVGGGFSGTFNNTISGDGGVAASNTLIDGQTVSLGGANTYNGVTAVNGGTLEVTNNAALGTGGTFDSRTTINGGDATATLKLSGGVSVNEFISLNGKNNTDASITSAGNNTLSNLIDGQGSGDNYNFESTSGTLTLSGTLSAADDGTPANFVFDGAGDFNISGKLTDADVDTAGVVTSSAQADVNVIKRGSGTLTVSTGTANADDFWNGATTIEAGALVVLDDGADNGELLTSSINVNAGATFDVDDFGVYSIQPVAGQNLGGAGTVKANTLQVLEGTSLTPGDSIGTLTIDGGLRLTYADTGTTQSNNDGRLNFELTNNGNGANDLIDVVNTTGSGNLDIFMVESLSDQFVVNVVPVDGTLDTTNNYTLIQYAGLLNNEGTSNGDGSNFKADVIDNLGNPLSTRYTFTVSTATSGEVQLDVGGVDPLTLTWVGTGTGSTGVWDVGVGTDFSNGSPQLFFDLDNVIFDDTATPKNVAIQNAVAPGSMTVNNSAGNDYTFTGQSINGFGGITKTGVGAATFENASIAVTGGLSITGGSVVLNTDASGSSGAISVGTGATLDVGVTANGTDLNILPSAGLSIVNNGTINVYDSEMISGMTGSGALIYHEENGTIGGNAGYDGDITLKSGVRITMGGAASQNHLGTATGSTTVEDGAMLTLQLDDGEAFVTSENFTVAGAGLGGAFDGALKNGTDNFATFTYNGAITLSADATLRTDSGGSVLAYNGAIDGSAANATLSLNVGNGGDGSTTNINGGMNLGTGGLTVFGTGVGQPGLGGVVNITVPVTYSGDTNIGVSGDTGTKLALTGTGNLGASANITVGSSGTLDVTGVGGYTLNNQTLTIDGDVVGNITATVGSTVNVNSANSMDGNLTANASSVTGEGRVTGDLIATNGSSVTIGGAVLPTLPTQYDFGNGAVDANTGVAANVVVAENALLSLGNVVETINGTTITLTGIQATAGDGSTSQWGANTQGIGIRSLDSGSGTGVDQGGSGGARRRISGQVGEAVRFSFDKDVTIDTLRAGNFTNGEVIEISFVSGTDPFAGGSWTLTGDGSQGPTNDVPVNVGVTAGTVLSFSASTSLQGGVLWNDIVVLVPDASPVGQDLEVDGNYSQDATSDLNVNVASASAFSTLIVGGTATLDGGLNINQENEMALGDEAVILTSNILSGTFDQTQITGFALTAPTEPSAVAVLYEDSGDVDTDADQVRLFATYRGDANGDGDVDLIDLDRLGSNWFATPGTVTWGQADFNYDGDVDLLDLNVLGANWFATPIVAPESAAPAVPEPASVLLLGLGALALSRKRR